MKKLFLYVFLVLMWCNVGFAECIEGDCDNGYGTYTFANGDKYIGEYKDGKLIKSKEKLMKKYDAFQSLDIEMKMKVAPLGLDFACYNACKERNVEAFCRMKCSIQ